MSELTRTCFAGALKLAMFLPGEKAKQSRSAMANILQRYYAGDASLIAEIEANAASTDPVAQMARASMAPESTIEDKALQSRKMLLDFKEREMELQVKRAKLDAMNLANRETELTVVTRFQQTMASLRADRVLDARTRLAVEDMAKNDFLRRHTKATAIANGDDLGIVEVPGWGTLSVSEVAQEMGHPRLDTDTSRAIGVAAAGLYRAKYNADPPKHRQWVNQVERWVNSYTTRDRDLVEQAVRETMVAPSPRRSPRQPGVAQFMTRPRA